MRPLSDLINTTEPAWVLIEDWKKNAKNQVEILPINSQKQADSALFYTQVTTRSPLGAVVHNTSGILIDDGWIRILGSGSDKLNRSLPSWNKGKSFKEYGEPMSFVLIADDASGGFFAINGGGFGASKLGKIFYLSADALDWECLDIGYTDFISFCFNGDIEAFYKDLRWKNWKKEVIDINGNQGFSFFPFLWTTTDKIKTIEDRSRNAVPIQELYDLKMDIREQLSKSKK